jgi:hypothetical protein
VEGYPIPLSKKSCARVVTYQQCADQHFEKTPAPLKRKDFMKNFLSSVADYDRALRISIRRADSDPCLHIAKVVSYFADAKLIPLAYDSLPQPLHAKYGMLSLRPFAAPTVLRFRAN